MADTSARSGPQRSPRRCWRRCVALRSTAAVAIAAAACGVFHAAHGSCFLTASGVVLWRGAGDDSTLGHACVAEITEERGIAHNLHCRSPLFTALAAVLPASLAVLIFAGATVGCGLLFRSANAALAFFTRCARLGNVTHATPRESSTLDVFYFLASTSALVVEGPHEASQYCDQPLAARLV